MANRLIGVEITPRTIRLAVLGQHRGVITVTALEQRPYADADELSDLLETMVPDGFQLTDRVATALPAGHAYMRSLQFPFKERRKIMAAAPFELASQLPVAPEECHTALLTPQDYAEGTRVVAAAVPKTTIDALLEPFQRNRLPLHILDLMPHALAGGIGDTIGTGLLICLNESEATVARLDGGQVAEHRHFPVEGQEPTPELVGQLLREAAACRHRMGNEQGPTFLTGALATPQLLEQMRSQGLPAQLFTLHLGHRDISPAFVPAVALALRAGAKVDDRCFNLRQGIYAFRGEAAAFRKTLYVFGGLFGASLLLFAMATALDYREKHRQADVLLQQMTRQYRETFPGSTITVDVPLQMQSKLQELRNRATALGIGSQPQVLPILKELSSLTERIPYEVEDLSCDQATCSLIGKTDSFEAVNRIKELLGASALFGKAEVAETRKGVDGSRIEFRLRLPLTATGGKP
ncbi:MAG: type II secretion system protein GspL [Desulfuromonadales bacterium]|nr:type II secretion system protein GspL [Desulfuromonadales bacterium]